MGTAELTSALHTEACDAFFDLKNAVRFVSPHLPPEPLTERYLRDTFKPLKPLEVIQIFKILAALERFEWLPFVDEMLGRLGAFVDLSLADVLLTAKDPRGAKKLRELYYANRDLEAGEDRVTVAWIRDVLFRHESDPEAERLIEEINLEETARYEARRKTS